MLKSFENDRKLTWLFALVSIGASYHPVFARGAGCAGDVDGDGDVDLLDYAEFSVCFSGPGRGASGADCECFDLDGDDDRDLSDFTLFSQGFTGPPGDCPPGQGQTDCGSGCTDVWWDENNCGDCGNVCAFGRSCLNGSCNPCAFHFLSCGGVCVDPWTTASDCGGCGIYCGGGQTCQGGVCQDVEPCWDCRDGAVIPGDFDDDGDVDLADFVEFQTCALGPAISQTDPVCTDAWLDADEDVDLDDFAVFHRCFSGEDNPADPNCVCPSGQVVCGAVCVDLLWNGYNCGACGNICQPVDHCSWGQCEGSCIDCEPPISQAGAVMIRGEFDEDGDVDLLDYAEFSICFSGPDRGSGGADCECFDLDGDDDRDLSDFTLFSQGFTGPPGDCPPGQGQADCGGGCIDVWWDENNCGTCGNQCASQDHCENGSCALFCGSPRGCYGGQLFCDGACREVQLDPAYCGCCGIHCDGGQFCQGGLCWDY